MIPLPSRKFISTVISICVALVLIFVASYFGKNYNKAITSKDEVSKENILKISKDSDNDGLHDWEEELWGTDINNPDSDGDGTKDGEEVSLGRNPMIAGPDDKLTAEEIQKKELFKPEENLTKTDAFSREVFASILALKQSGQLNTESLNNLISSFSENIFSKNYLSSYQLSDLNITLDTSDFALKKYGNELSASVQKHFSSDDKNELLVIDEALANEDDEKIKELTIFIQKYDKLNKELLTMLVPAPLSEYHLAVVNSVENTKKSLTDAKSIFDDALIGLSGILQYQEELISLSETADEIRMYLKSKNIYFNKSEVGYKYFNID